MGCNVGELFQVAVGPGEVRSLGNENAVQFVDCLLVAPPFGDVANDSVDGIALRSGAIPGKPAIRTVDGAIPIFETYGPVNWVEESHGLLKGAIDVVRMHEIQVRP